MKQGITILIVGEEERERQAICRAMQFAKEPVECWEADSGEAAIAHLLRQNFDGVFLVDRLPDGDGLTWVRLLRSRSIQVPLIVLSQQDSDDIALEAITAGASDYLVKERVSDVMLCRSMSRAIRIERLESEAAIAQAQLRETEERYSLVLAGSNDAIWDWDIVNNQIYWNQRIEEIIGVSATELSLIDRDFCRTMETFFELLHPDDRQRMRDAINEHLNSNAKFNLEFRLRHSSGEYRYCLTRAKVQRDATGKPIRMAGIVSDITHRKKTEVELHRRQQEFKNLADENAFLYQESQQASDNLRKAVLILAEQQQQLRTLQHLTNLLNQRLTNLPELLQVMVQTVVDAIAGAQFCIIVLDNPQCDRLFLTVTAGIGADYLRLDDAFLSNDGWLSQAISQSENALDPEAIARTSTRRSSPQSVCGVEINSPQGGRLGGLAIGNWDDPEAFDAEDRNLLIAVAEQAAIAINNARLIKTLEEREDRLAAQNELLANQNKELDYQRQQIQLQNLQLMEAAKLKSQFLATMSHELRTPMNAVIGFSQLLLHASKRSRFPCRDAARTQSKGMPLAPEQENMVQRILDNGKHLLSLIDDILDLSKIESGRLELEPEQFNLENLVTSTVEELRSLAQQKNLDLQVSPHLTNPVVFNDSVRLRQILINLLSNAIKFTEKGSVQVEVWNNCPDKIILAVKDTGIGISPENLEHIFETFRQVDQSLSKKHYGTGLGLSIARSLLQMMNGKITVQSALGEGSTFRIEIPRNIPVSNHPSSSKPNRKLLR